MTSAKSSLLRGSSPAVLPSHLAVKSRRRGIATLEVLTLTAYSLAAGLLFTTVFLPKTEKAFHQEATGLGVPVRPPYGNGARERSRPDDERPDDYEPRLLPWEKMPGAMRSVIRFATQAAVSKSVTYVQGYSKWMLAERHNVAAGLSSPPTTLAAAMVPRPRPQPSTKGASVPSKGAPSGPTPARPAAEGVDEIKKPDAPHVSRKELEAAAIRASAQATTDIRKAVDQKREKEKMDK